MDLQKINVKFFARDAAQPPLGDFIPVFHSWIQQTDGAYYDVADYTHVDGGPGVLLIAHQANISIDEQDGRRGLLFNQKRPSTGSNREKLRDTLNEALRYCLKLEREPSLHGKVEFRGDEAAILINDRLLAPNTEETLEELRDDLQAIGALLFGSTEFGLHRDGHPEHRFSVRFESREPLRVRELLANLARGESKWAI